MTCDVAIKFPIIRGSEQASCTYAWFSPVCDGVVYDGPDGNKAKRELRAKITETLNNLVTESDRSNKRRRVIGCGDGTVLIVAREHGAWGYTMHGAGRSGYSSCCGAESFETCVADAKRHAESSYAGVAWEN